jgi:predicted transcriptional regulator
MENVEEKKKVNELTAIVFAIISTAAEFQEEGLPMPASSVYMACGMDMAKYEKVTQIAVDAGYITKTSEQIFITEKGKELHNKLKQVGLGEKK